MNDDTEQPTTTDSEHDSSPETAPAPDSDASPARDSPDRDRYTTTDRGPGEGDWLEGQVELALERWGYRTARNVDIYCREVDIVATRRNPTGTPADYLVVEVKDWADTPISEDIVDRLITLAFTGRAMPVLVTPSDLTKRAWQIAQAWDVRLLDIDDLQAESLPDLTKFRTPPDTANTEESIDPFHLRGLLPNRLRRDGPDTIQAPVFDDPIHAPAYVPDRDAHQDYTYAPDAD